MGLVAAMMSNSGADRGGTWDSGNARHVMAMSWRAGWQTLYRMD
jgi:hypothetical protein